MHMRKKPGPTARARARKRRTDTTYAATIRIKVFDRDELCRLIGVDDCAGPEEWAHWGEHQWFKTRGLPPEQRHTTGGTFKSCRSHHQRYDAGEIAIEALDPARGADWYLAVTVDGVTTHV